MLVVDCTLFFFNDTATTEIYTLSLHDALPIWDPDRRRAELVGSHAARRRRGAGAPPGAVGDRKSTRLNSSHGYTSYAVFCLKKKKTLQSIRPERQTYERQQRRHQPVRVDRARA